MLKSISSEIDAVFEKKVSRKGFLQHVGVAALGVLGVQSLLSSILQPASSKSKATKQDNSYGGSSYGG